MKLGMAIRTMGPQSRPDVLLACARAAEAAGIDDVWVPDHVAIPPDDAEGSNGRYLDPLAALAWLAAATTRIGLGTGVLILPYRPPLLVAKAAATIQELSGGRLSLGVGVGWMEAEFRALGVDRGRRGALTDEALELLARCFASDEVTLHGQPFLFRPRPPRPPVFVGGAPPRALERTVRHGDGWMPIGVAPGDLAAPVKELRARFEEAGRAAPEVVVMTRLPLDELSRAADAAAAFVDAGATGIVHAARYADAAEYAESAGRLAALRAGLES